jgi:hypothetical protein
MKWIPRWVRQTIVRVVLEELVVGAHCGCCGKWIPDRIAEASWPVSVCGECISDALTENEQESADGRTATYTLTEIG